MMRCTMQLPSFHLSIRERETGIQITKQMEKISSESSSFESNFTLRGDDALTNPRGNSTGMTHPESLHITEIFTSVEMRHVSDSRWPWRYLL